MLQQGTLLALVIAANSTLIAVAQEPNRLVDMARIRSVIAAVNEARRDSGTRALSRLFAPDGTLRVDSRIIATGRDAIEKALEKSQVWNEVTAPTIHHESVHFVAPDVALVDATQTQYGSLILKRTVPVTLLMKLDGQEWWIISLWL
jgi:uncharacterized protein (TIGR02246 family)